MTNKEPWLAAQGGQGGSLALTESILTFVAGYTAAGNQDGLRRAWRELDPQDHIGGIEAILQTHLFAGFPRTINAMRTVRELGPIHAGEHRERSKWSTDWGQAGEQLCRKIYDRNYEKLRENMSELHPDLDRWMLEVGYGRVLSRPGLSARMRELCAIAVLAGQDVAPQLFSHLRGALHVGATILECESVIGQTEFIWGQKAQQQALEVLQRVQLKLKATYPER